MQELLANPAVQSAVLPALVASIAWALVGRTRALAAVPLAGWAAVVALAVGFSLEPLSARSKLVIALAASALLALALDWLRVQASARVVAALAALATGAALWIALRVLEQREGAAAWWLGLGVGAWAAAAVAAVAWADLPTPRALVVAAALGFTTAALGLLGASASIAMMGIALGASYAIALAAGLGTGRLPHGLRFVGLQAAAFAALGGEVASLTGELPWTALLPLPLIPLAARLAPRRFAAPAADAALTAAACALPALVAAALAWRAAGGASS